MGIHLKKKVKTVKLYTLDYDNINMKYIRTLQAVDPENVPPAAVHLSGKKGYYFLDLTGLWTEPDPNRLSAIDLYLYMVNNSISQALANRGALSGNIDIMKIIGFAAVGIVGACIVFALM